MQFHAFQDLIQWADELSAVMSDRKRSDLVSQIDEAKTALATNTFTLAVLGKAKRGKSTLINALLGRKDDTLAPIDKLPTSSAITRFRSGDTESASVLFQNGKIESILYDDIRKYVVEELNPGNKKEVAMLEVVGQFPNLPRQVELVDTPGAGSIHEHHDALLHAFIPQADAVIFLVTARMPLDQEELDLLKEVKKQDISKIFFVINKVDESEAEDIEKAVDHNQKLLAQCGITPEGFHKISAKYAYLGKPESNVPELTADIHQFLAKYKGAVLRHRFISKIGCIVESELRAMEVVYSSGNRTGAELDADIAHLSQQKRELGGKREYQEKEFQRKWKTAVDLLDSKLGKVETDVTADTKDKIAKTWTLGVGKLVKELPTFLNQSISNALEPLTEQFEKTTREACEELNAEYPALTLDETGRTTFSSPKDMAVTTAVIGGGTVAAGGLGIASAGAAAAATIATANAASVAAVATAGAAAASSAASTASIITGIGIAIDAASTYLIGMPLGASLAGAGGAVTVAAPTLLSTPLWVALSGPVGWTLAGVGVLAVPFAWRLSKLKQKEKLEEETLKQIKMLFKGIREDRITAIRKMGESILEGFRNNLDYKIKQLEDALNDAKTNRPSDAELSLLKRQCEATSQLMAKSLEWMNATT
ncbi:MAG: dynamin family protein [Planctomycetaceae bacterium]|jgi:ribosome biogenesis GTPase A|nr:dynamin family protein [Planctomycetaceae bacterium]